MYHQLLEMHLCELKDHLCTVDKCMKELMRFDNAWQRKRLKRRRTGKWDHVSTRHTSTFQVQREENQEQSYTYLPPIKHAIVTIGVT